MRPTTIPARSQAPGAFALGLAFVASACASPAAPGAASQGPVAEPGFWDHWGDGKAELAGYDLIYPRYGELRQGTAVAIFVTETFSNSQRVKHEGPEAPEGSDPDRFPVMKQNLVQDFPTGIYDYNLMTSSFVALAGVNGRPAGTPTKIAFSAQEWCGHVYAQVLFDERELRHESHSYFDGEADAAGRLEFPAGGLAEDALLLWSRGLAGPRLAPGASRQVPLLRSLERVRLAHVDLEWDTATLSRAAAPETVSVPAGDYEVERFEAAITGSAGALTWTFLVERAAPHRLARWSHDRGLVAELRGSTRLPYWQLNGPGQERALAELGF